MKKMRYVGLYENVGLVNGCIYDVSDYEPWNQVSTIHLNGVVYNVARSSLEPVHPDEEVVIQKIDNTITSVKDHSKLLQKKQQWIDEIMDEFDFNKVAKAMKALEWKWHDAFEGIPTESEIRKQARHMLSSIDIIKVGYTSTGYYSTGGFIAEGNYNNNNELESLSLVFQLCELEAYD